MITQPDVYCFFFLFNRRYNMIAIDLSRQQALDAVAAAIENTTMEVAKETIFDFSQGNVGVLWIFFFFNMILI